MLIKVDPVRLIIEFANELEVNKGVRKITDENGRLSVPMERFGDFSHDIGILLARAMQRSSFLEE